MFLLVTVSIVSLVMYVYSCRWAVRLSDCLISIIDSIGPSVVVLNKVVPVVTAGGHLNEIMLVILRR